MYSVFLAIACYSVPTCFKIDNQSLDFSCAAPFFHAIDSLFYLGVKFLRECSIFKMCRCWGAYLQERGSSFAEWINSAATTSLRALGSDIRLSWYALRASWIPTAWTLKSSVRILYFLVGASGFPAVKRKPRWNKDTFSFNQIECQTAHHLQWHQ